MSNVLKWKIMTHPNPVGWKRKFELLVRTRKILESEKKKSRYSIIFYVEIIRVQY